MTTGTSRAATAGSHAPARGPIFVVGAARSGTTLLRLLLNEHPDIAIPSESHFFGALFRAFPPTATLAADDLAAAVDIVASSPEWQRDFAHSEAELREAVGAGPMPIGEFVERVFRLEVGPAAARWGDKTPANLHWVGTLLTCFPDAQVVAIVRDPRDVALSLARLGWYGDTAWAIGRYLERNGRAVRQLRQHHDPRCFRVVRYEDVVLDTEATLRGLCDYLGVSFVAAMQDFYARADQHVQPWELQTGLHTKLRRAPSPDDVGQWRRTGRKWRHAQIEAMTIDVVREYGYERRVPDRALAAVRATARATHHARAPLHVAARAATKLGRTARRATGRRAT
jgi:hypothetical protein